MITTKILPLTREDNDASSSSLSQYSSNSRFTKGTTKISHVVLLSAAWAAKINKGIKPAYFKHRNSDNFIIK
jgi:hypothetical protein